MNFFGGFKSGHNLQIDINVLKKKVGYVFSGCDDNKNLDTNYVLKV